MDSKYHAKKALHGVNGTYIKDKELKVQLARADPNARGPGGYPGGDYMGHGPPGRSREAGW